VFAHTKSLLIPILAAACGLFAAAPASAQSFAHIDRLAVALEGQAEQLHAEVHAHFRPTPAYRHLDRDVAEMERLARHIHEVAHYGGSVRHLRTDVERYDRLYHHVEEVIADATLCRGLDYRALVHFRSIMTRMGRTLHHLRDDLAQLGGGHPFPGRPPITIQPTYYPRPVGPAPFHPVYNPFVSP
jgi:ATP phosphoribosyltransferase regulatory subunit HisZ